MTVFQKLKEKVYHYFNPSIEECLIRAGIIDDPNMTPEELEEYMRGIDVINALVDSYCSSGDSEEGDDSPASV